MRGIPASCGGEAKVVWPNGLGSWRMGRPGPEQAWGTSVAERSLLSRRGFHLQPQISRGRWRGLAGHPGLETSALSSALPPTPTFHLSSAHCPGAGPSEAVPLYLGLHAAFGTRLARWSL